MVDLEWNRKTIFEKLDWLKETLEDVIVKANQNIAFQKEQLQTIIVRLMELEKPMQKSTPARKTSPAKKPKLSPPKKSATTRKSAPMNRENSRPRTRKR